MPRSTERSVMRTTQPKSTKCRYLGSCFVAVQARGFVLRNFFFESAMNDWKSVSADCIKSHPSWTRDPHHLFDNMVFSKDMSIYRTRDINDGFILDRAEHTQ